MATYTVKQGDNLYNIAKRELGDPMRWQEIASLNSNINPSKIRPGDVLQMPTSGNVTYTVKTGDFLSTIANRYGTTVDAIKKANNIKDVNVIHPNDVLTIPSSSKTPSSRFLWPDQPKRNNDVSKNGNTNTSGDNNRGGQPKQYTVKSNDTLSEIAATYGISTSELAKLNGITDYNKIRVGQTLRLPDYVNMPKGTSWHPENELIQSNKDAGRDLQAIQWYHENIKPNEYYLITDKVNSKIYVCRAGKIMKTYDSRMGIDAAKDDVMTITYTDDKGNLLDMEGDQSAPAGLFKLQVSPSKYYGEPAFISYTEDMYNSGEGKGMPNLIHYYPNLETNGTSNGCFRVRRESVRDLYNRIGNSTIRHYILPANPENYFFIKSNEIQFHAGAKYEEPVYNKYTGEEIRKVGWAKVPSTQTKVSLPLKIKWDLTGLDGNQKRTVKQFAGSLVNNKDQLIKDLGINSDSYDQLAQIALGILGEESNYGQQRGILGNILHSVVYAAGEIPGLDKLKEIRPDQRTKEKIVGWTTSDENEKAQYSVGITQIRYAYLTDDEKALFDKYGITREDLVNDPSKAAIATMIKLAHSYRPNASLDQAIKNWNSGKYYPDNIKKNMQRFQIFTKYANGGRVRNILRKIAQDNGEHYENVLRAIYR